MERLSIDFSNLTLPSMDLLDDETWLCSPTNDNGVSKCKEEIFEWLKGGPTFDFQTRSALSRKLMKKRSRKNHPPKLPSLDDELNELLSLEADLANENFNQNDGETIVLSTETSHNIPENMVASTPNLGEVDEGEENSDSDELFFDAPDEPEVEEPIQQQKPLPLTEKLNIVVEQPEHPSIPQSLSKSYSIDVATQHLRSSSISPDTRSQFGIQNGYGRKSSDSSSQRQTRMTPSPKIPTLKQRSSSRPPSLDSEMKVVECKTDLSEIERRAKEQEEDLRAQLRQTRGRLISSKSDQNGPESRPMSSSTSSSSTLASSKSVEFQPANLANGRPSTSASASRLPVPARRFVSGNSKIPIPFSRTLARPSTASQASNLRTSSAQGFYDTTPRTTNTRSRLTIANHLSIHDNWTDDECF